MNRSRRPGRRQLHDAHALGEDEVGVLPPAQSLVEVLGPLDIGNGKNHDLESEIHVHRCSAPSVGGVASPEGVPSGSTWPPGAGGRTRATPGSDRVQGVWGARGE